jgi:hypothetical protein
VDIVLTDADADEQTVMELVAAGVDVRRV